MCIDKRLMFLVRFFCYLFIQLNSHLAHHTIHSTSPNKSTGLKYEARDAKKMVFPSLSTLVMLYWVLWMWIALRLFYRREIKPSPKKSKFERVQVLLAKHNQKTNNSIRMIYWINKLNKFFVVVRSHLFGML